MGSWRTWKKVWQSLKSSFLVKTIASSKESGWSLQPGAYSKPRLVNPDSPFRIDFFVQSLYVIGKMSFSFGQNLSVSQLDEISISVASHGYCSCGSCTMIFEAGAESLYFTGDYKLCYCLETWEWRLSYINSLIRRTMGNLTGLGFHPKKMCILRNKITTELFKNKGWRVDYKNWGISFRRQKDGSSPSQIAKLLVLQSRWYF